MYQLFPLCNVKQSAPATSYIDASRRLAQVQAAEARRNDGAILSQCATQLFDHGGKTEHVIVMLHGFTNCPHQFHQLAPLLHQRGHTVLLPRLPRHGYSDRLTKAPAGLTVAELANAATEAVDIALGFGHCVTVLGFSLGGVLAAWLAQERADLHHVILASPALGIQVMPPHRRRIAAYLLAMLPNFFRWWNPELKDKRMGPDHAYPRFSSRGLAALLRLGLLVVDAAEHTKPATTSITVIDNPNDPVIDHNTLSQLAELWCRHGAIVTTKNFPAEWQLIHDLIDPSQEQQQIERVYPMLLQWIDQGIAKGAC